MKSNCVFGSVILISILTIKCYAQNENYSFIQSAPLGITYNKTTNLIFPYSVQSIDRGSNDILVQQPKGTENIVQVKAGKPNFVQTNLSVITSDGKLYSFTVDYVVQPSQLNIILSQKDIQKNDLISMEPVMLSSVHNEAVLQSVAEKITATKPVHGKKDKHNQMKLQLNGIYVNADVLYFRLQLQNSSNLSYNVDNIRFSIEDQQKAKRTATQEMEIQPIYTYGSFENVQGNASASCIIALPKFTLPDSKYLSVQVLEKDGGRNLHFTLKNRHIMHAKIISDSN